MRTCAKYFLRVMVWSALAALAAPVWAHKPSDSYLRLRIEGAQIDGQWDIALRDLDPVLDLDGNADRVLDWGEVRTRADDLDAYALARLSLASDGRPCPLAVSDHLVDRHTDGAYAVLKLHGTCAGPVQTLSIDYRLLFDIDAQHRGLLHLERGADGQTVASAVFPKQNAHQQFSIAGGSAWRALGGFIADGVRHIAIGYDHILFLIALLLPAVLRREGWRWKPLDSFPASLWNVAKTVTAFTLAHSITLSLATLGWVQLPSRLVESAIALSVLATALDNLVPILPRQRWQIAFAFGLLHGFGFASVLRDLELPRSALALSLFGFNLGVEIGQLILVALLIPLAFVLRSTWFYSRIAMRGGSVLIAILALGWLLERCLDWKLMPF